MAESKTEPKKMLIWQSVMDHQQTDVPDVFLDIRSAPFQYDRIDSHIFLTINDHTQPEKGGCRKLLCSGGRVSYMH